MTLDDVANFAKSQGYESAAYIGEWRGYTVYEPMFAAGEVSCIGLPFVILVDGSAIRMSTEDEAFAQMRDMPDE